MKDFFLLNDSFEYILDRKFNLQYYLNLSFADHDNTQLKELKWMYGKLIKKIKEESTEKGSQTKRWQKQF